MRADGEGASHRGRCRDAARYSRGDRHVQTGGWQAQAARPMHVQDQGTKFKQKLSAGEYGQTKGSTGKRELALLHTCANRCCIAANL